MSHPRAGTERSGGRGAFLLVALACAALILIASAPAVAAQRSRVPAADRVPPDARVAIARQAYDRGYREGIERGERDGRDERAFNYERDDWYRSADRGYNRAYGSRDAYRTEYRRGFAAGYRDGYGRVRVVVRDGRDGRFGGRGPLGYSDPAVARGYSDGYAHGFDDGDDRDRYDPARHGDYRDADQGYKRHYGSKDAYREQYRAGFRQGYEDGYQTGVRR